LSDWVSQEGVLRAGGAVRRVLFYGKSMARTRCTGALVDALVEHGLDVRWRNLSRWRRWFGKATAHRLARAEFNRFKPDVVFVFHRDLPMVLLDEFRQHARVVLWCEEMLEGLDRALVSYFLKADLVCLSNPTRMAWLREQGLDSTVFLMSGFSSRYHRPAGQIAKRCDVAFIGSPGGKGQRVEFLARISDRFDTHVYGRGWEQWKADFPQLNIRGQATPRTYAKVCASSSIVLGTNEENHFDCYFSNRTFLTLGCGGFHLTHYVPQLERVFENGKHLVWFRDEDEALQLIGRWLEDPVGRRKIAAAGHGYAVAHHRYFHRVARILQLLRDGRPSEPMLNAGPSFELPGASQPARGV
jgi:hypothetical protein